MTLPAQDIVERLREWLADPMWADHVEFPKSALRRTITCIVSLTADNDALRQANAEAIAAHHRTSHKAVKRLRALWREKQAAEARADALAQEVERLRSVRPLDDWHEDDGFVTWWTWRDGAWLGEPSYIGSPLCSDWPGYHTHWTPHPVFPRRSRRPAMSARDVIADAVLDAAKGMGAVAPFTGRAYELRISDTILSALHAAGYRLIGPTKFDIGQRVTKIKGSSWTGKVVGFYSTSLTPIGYDVESENEPGSVQIYPEAALRLALREKDDG